ncbi:HigA family addiction module antitoxin [Sedimenticola hydrogenitrophicus]|uniref:HigA family addiction module antitoxin n=1 Tax=Sedimenticola hydrogenitrophicus TaxID=2967975 RepID=UPI0023AFCBDF|nr:HigA family addiction module antitoxin [Sedimenticola hydrogenitrophicus]
MTMYNPPHPGSILRQDVLPALKMTVTEAASELGVSRAALSRVVNEHAAISPEMALRIEAWFRRLGYKGGRAEQWVGMQMDHDMWLARKKWEAA